MLLLLNDQKILPAVTFPNAKEAEPVAAALIRGGLKILEVPFRTEQAIESIKIIKRKFPEMRIGAGTLLRNDQVLAAIDAGAEFGLCPALNVPLLEFAAKNKFPFIPGVMTPSEIEAAYFSGCELMKLFPAEQVGGVKFLQALQGPYDHLNLQFIPMGGVNLDNMNSYLALRNVTAIGGSWLAPIPLITSKDYEGIERNTREALAKIQIANG